MNWELLRERIFQYYTPDLIGDIHTLIPTDCACSRIDERIDVDEVLCGGCSSLLREQREGCYSLSITTERYEGDITPFYPDELLEEISPSFPHSILKIYRTSNPLLQKFVTGSVFSELTNKDSNVQGLWECNHSTFLKENKFISLLSEEFPKIKPKKLLSKIIEIFGDVLRNDFYLSSPDVNSIIILNDEDVSLKVDEKTFITYKGVRSIYSINKFNVFSNFQPQISEITISIPKGCDSYLSKECKNQIYSKTSSTSAFKLTDELLFYQKELGYPLFSTQFSLYGILLSLYTLPSFSSFFETNKVYSKVWQGLFSIEEYPEVLRELRLLSHMNFHTFDKILPILKKIHLRRDVVEYLSDKF